jgi:plasmid replication initiation protein
MEIALSQNKVLKKHVGLIHSSSKLNLLEMKIADVFLKNAVIQGVANNFYIIGVQTLCSLINYNSQNYTHLKTALRSLMKREVKFNVLNEKFNNDNTIYLEATTLIASVRVRNGECRYEYSQLLKEKLFDPARYGLINLVINSKFKSKFGYLLYNNCARFQNIAETAFMDISVFRKLMGVGEGEYLIFRDLNRRVIKPGIKEVNEVSNLWIEPIFKKTKRNVVAIKFLIKPKKLKIEDSKMAHLSPEAHALLDRLIKEFGFRQKRALQLIDDFGEEYIVEKIKLVKQTKAYQGKTIIKMHSYLEKFLIDDVKQGIDSARSKKVCKQLNQQEDTLRENYEKFLGNCLAEDIFSIDDDVKDHFKRVEKNTYFDPYANPVRYVGANDFLRFIALKHPFLLKKYMSFKEFEKQTKEKSDA